LGSPGNGGKRPKKITTDDESKEAPLTLSIQILDPIDEYNYLIAQFDG